MGRSKNYTDEYKEMISDLYNSGMSVTETSGEYGIGWIKNNKKIKVSDEEFMTMKEIAKIKNKKIKDEIIKIYKERYGAPKIHVILIRNGFKISLKKTQKLRSS